MLGVVREIVKRFSRHITSSKQYMYMYAIIATVHNVAMTTTHGVDILGSSELNLNVGRGSTGKREVKDSGTCSAMSS